MKYIIYRGEYPFDQIIGQVDAPKDQPEVALQRAKRITNSMVDQYPENERVFIEHPVVEPQPDVLDDVPF